MIEIVTAIIKNAAKDLESPSTKIQAQAAQYFASPDFEEQCRRYAIDHGRIREKVSEIYKEGGVRKKKLIRDLAKEVSEYH